MLFNVECQITERVHHMLRSYGTPNYRRSEWELVEGCDNLPEHEAREVVQAMNSLDVVGDTFRFKYRMVPA